jgi:hypothetical protein
MQDTSVTVDRLLPSATPSKAEIRAWNALPRDEQVRRMREALTHPDCSTPSSRSMAEVLAEARANADAAELE